MTLSELSSPGRPLTVTDKRRVKRYFTKADYRAIDDVGGFDKVGHRITLFRGQLVEEPPMTWDHATGVQHVSNYAFRRMDPRFIVRVQLPVDAPGDTEPEPDVAVFTPEQIVHRPHPNAAELLIEVAFSSLEDDIEVIHEYAVIAREYWIVDVLGRRLLVYRNPHRDAVGLFGVAFDPPVTLAEGDSIAPLCDPSAVVTIRDLLPPLT